MASGHNCDRWAKQQDQPNGTFPRSGLAQQYLPLPTRKKSPSDLSTLSPSLSTKQMALRLSFQSIVRGSKLLTLAGSARSVPAIRTGRLTAQSVAVWMCPQTVDISVVLNSSPPFQPRIGERGSSHFMAAGTGAPSPNTVKVFCAMARSRTLGF